VHVRPGHGSLRQVSKGSAMSGLFGRVRIFEDRLGQDRPCLSTICQVKSG
jgi:hypothetical protein